eukprot:gene337-biopygen141
MSDSQELPRYVMTFVAGRVPLMSSPHRLRNHSWQSSTPHKDSKEHQHMFDRAHILPNAPVFVNDLFFYMCTGIDLRFECRHFAPNVREVLSGYDVFHRLFGPAYHILGLRASSYLRGRKQRDLASTWVLACHISFGGQGEDWWHMLHAARHVLCHSAAFLLLPPSFFLLCFHVSLSSYLSLSSVKPACDGSACWPVAKVHVGFFLGFMLACIGGPRGILTGIQVSAGDQWHTNLRRGSCASSGRGTSMLGSDGDRCLVLAGCMPVSRFRRGRRPVLAGLHIGLWGGCIPGSEEFVPEIRCPDTKYNGCNGLNVVYAAAQLDEETIGSLIFSSYPG